MQFSFVFQNGLHHFFICLGEQATAAVVDRCNCSGLSCLAVEETPVAVVPVEVTQESINYEDIPEMLQQFYWIDKLLLFNGFQNGRMRHITVQQFFCPLMNSREKMQLMLVMSRKAKLYLLDEPIAGVDPAARDFILRTILTNYNEEGTVLISTHLISDVEQVLDEAVFLQNGRVILHKSVDDIREEHHKSVDALFREMFRAQPVMGGDF